jgi:hypothetical protein
MDGQSGSQSDSKEISADQSASPPTPWGQPDSNLSPMTIADDRQLAGPGFVIEDMLTGAYASGFGQADDGRSFSFHIEHQQLVVEVYRPGLTGPVPQAEDVIATSSWKLIDIDVTDERSLAAAVRDAVAAAEPVSR